VLPPASVLQYVGSGKASLPNYVVPVSPQRGKLVGALKWVVSCSIFSCNSAFYPKSYIGFMEMTILSLILFLNL
jgi:hypothetical protein